MKPRNLVCIALAIACANACGISFAQTIVERANKDEVALVKSGDAAMDAAFAKARATLDDFLSKLKSPAAGTSGYAVKVPIREGDSTEYFWMGSIKQDGDRFSGTLNNTPRMVKSVKMGQTIKFAKSEIVDWTYLDKISGKMHGNFTACALLKNESAESAAAFKRQFGLSCD
jgi:uncharacterized protein YegJ (DUF2314 family)